MDNNEKRNPDYDKLLLTVNMLTSEEIHVFLMMAHTILLERQYIYSVREDKPYGEFNKSAI